MLCSIGGVERGPRRRELAATAISCLPSRQSAIFHEPPYRPAYDGAWMGFLWVLRERFAGAAKARHRGPCVYLHRCWPLGFSESLHGGIFALTPVRTQADAQREDLPSGDHNVREPQFSGRKIAPDA